MSLIQKPETDFTSPSGICPIKAGAGSGGSCHSVFHRWAGPTWSHVKGSTEAVENVMLLITTLNKTTVVGRRWPEGPHPWRDAQTPTGWTLFEIGYQVTLDHCQTGSLLLQDHNCSFWEGGGTDTTGCPPPPSSHDLNVTVTSGTLRLYPQLQGCPSVCQMWTDTPGQREEHALTLAGTQAFESRAMDFQRTAFPLQFHFHETIVHFCFQHTLANW